MCKIALMMNPTSATNKTLVYLYNRKLSTYGALFVYLKIGNKLKSNLCLHRINVLNQIDITIRSEYWEENVIKY